MLTILEKLKYLVLKDEDKRVTIKYLRTSNFKFNNIICGQAEIGKAFTSKVSKAFNQRIKDDVLFELEKNFVLENIVNLDWKASEDKPPVKNYDDDDSLTDLDTYNSSHGVNKGGGCHRVHSN